MGIEQLHFEEVEFCNEGGEISLDIPKEGISVDGWKIVPAVYPLKVLLNNYIDGTCNSIVTSFLFHAFR